MAHGRTEVVKLIAYFTVGACMIVPQLTVGVVQTESTSAVINFKNIKTAFWAGRS
jgi:hypothetical protein